MVTTSSIRIGWKVEGENDFSFFRKVSERESTLDKNFPTYIYLRLKMEEEVALVKYLKTRFFRRVLRSLATKITYYLPFVAKNDFRNLEEIYIFALCFLWQRRRRRRTTVYIF